MGAEGKSIIDYLMILDSAILNTGGPASQRHHLPLRKLYRAVSGHILSCDGDMKCKLSDEDVASLRSEPVHYQMRHCAPWFKGSASFEKGSHGAELTKSRGHEPGLCAIYV